jgi:hypothetical protein
MPPANWKQALEAVTKNKQENFDKIQVDNRIKRSGVLNKSKKYNKKLFFQSRGI